MMQNTPENEPTIIENATRVLAPQLDQLTPTERFKVVAAVARGEGDMVRGANEILLHVAGHTFEFPVLSLVKPRDPSLN